MFGNSFEGAFKSLKNVVEELTKKGQTREAKIKDNLQMLTREAQAVKNEISLKTQQLVDAEIEDDVKAQGQINQELNQLRLQLDTIEGKLSAYKSNLEFPGLSNGEVEKIKSAVLKARQERQKKASELDTQLQKAYKQVQALNEEIKQLNEEKFVLEQPKEAFIAKPVMLYVHPEFRDERYEKQLGSYQYSFDNWLTGQN